MAGNLARTEKIEMCTEFWSENLKERPHWRIIVGWITRK